MTNKIYKRTYRVAFHPNVVKMIEGAKEGVCVMWGYHDLIDHDHEDDVFQSKDVALQDTFQEMYDYSKKHDRELRKNMKELAKKQGWTTKDLKRIAAELDADARRREEERMLAGQRIQEMMDSGQLEDAMYFHLIADFQKQQYNEYSKNERKVKGRFKKEGRLTFEQIQQKSDYLACETCGDYPRGYQGLDNEGNAPVWKPIFDRGYWEFEHISEDVPDWISEREYSIAHEELYEPEVEKLKTKKGSKVNWASRNRGNKVVVSSKSFRKDTKVYPNHLNPGV